MLSKRSSMTALIAACGMSWAAVNAASTSAPPADASHGNWKTVQQFCFDCHNVEDWAGGIAFDSMSGDAIPQDAKIWEKAVRKLRGGMMPPPGHKRPDAAAVKNLVSYLETTLDDASTHPDPGRVPLRRLNRREYANAVHDLIGLDVDAAVWLPQDPLKDGFDTNAELLQVTPNFLDQSVAAARALALQAVGDPEGCADRHDLRQHCQHDHLAESAPRHGHGQSREIPGRYAFWHPRWHGCRALVRGGW